jgi:hypothetical protein
MRYKGNVINLAADIEQEKSDIQEAIVTNQKISSDWEESDTEFHAQLISKDNGVTYTGSFGYPELNRNCTMKAKKYTANNGEILLWITWEDQESGNGGIDIIRLKPETPAKPTKPKTKAKKKPS